MPKLIHGPPKFGFLCSPIFRERAKYFPEYEKDAFKLVLPYEQPILWIYGDRDPLKPLTEQCLVQEGDYTIIKHKYAHNIPKFVGEELDTFCSFLDRMYNDITGERMELNFTKYHDK